MCRCVEQYLKERMQHGQRHIRLTEKSKDLLKREEIVLVVDCREGGGYSGKKDKGLEGILSMVARDDIRVEVHTLRVGDFAVIVRSFFGEFKRRLSPVVERKTISDLASSLEDGRWERQKKNMVLLQEKVTKQCLNLL